MAGDPRRTQNERPEQRIARCIKCLEWKSFDEFIEYTDEQKKKKGLRRHTHACCNECEKNRWREYERKRRIRDGLPAVREKREDLERGVAKCNKCGLEKLLSDFPPSDFRSKCLTHSWCRQCHKEWSTSRREKNNDRQSARRREQAGQPNKRARLLFWAINSRRKKTPVSLPMEWFQKKINAGVCEATGVKLNLAAPAGDGLAHSRYPNAPSVDRVDSLKGYSEENSRMTSLIFNMAKGVWTDEDVVSMSYALLKKKGFTVTSPEGWRPTCEVPALSRTGPAAADDA